MSKVLIALGALLIVWGGFVLVTGDYVATLDIAAGLIASGVGVIAVAGVVQALDRIAGRLGPTTASAEVLESKASTPVVAAPSRASARATPEAASQEPSETEPPKVEVAEPEIAKPEEAPPLPSAPELVREGVIEGRRYRFFSDGSIEAEGPRGVRRYRSIEEAREQILRDRSEQEAAAPPPRSSTPPVSPLSASIRKPGRADAPYPPREAAAERAPREPAAQRPPRGSAAERPPRIAEDTPAREGREAKPAKSPSEVTWDSYLASRNRDKPRAEAEKPRADPYAPAKEPKASEAEPPSSDDEWAEPLRMLLKGEDPEDPGKPER